MEIHGHRGSRGTHPENTLIAFQEAIDCGADYFEIDVHLSKDNEVIVFHDPVLSNRFCLNPQGKELLQEISLRELLSEEIIQYDCGSRKQPQFPEQKIHPGQKIPTLRQLFIWMAEKRSKTSVNIEVKVEATEERLFPDIEIFAKKIEELVKQYNLEEEIQIQSFHEKFMISIQKLLPKTRLSLLFNEKKDFLQVAQALDFRWIGPHFSLLTQDLITKCHQKGIGIIPWTVNKAEDWERLVAWNIDGMITDYPRRLKEWLK